MKRKSNVKKPARRRAKPAAKPKERKLREPKMPAQDAQGIPVPPPARKSLPPEVAEAAVKFEARTGFKVQRAWETVENGGVAAPGSETLAPKRFAVPAEQGPPEPRAPKCAVQPADAPATAPTAKAGNGSGKRVKILGYGICAIAKALGAAGVKRDEADRILLAHGVAMPKASLSVQLGFGRNRECWGVRGKPAPLTAKELGDLRAMVVGAA